MVFVHMDVSVRSLQLVQSSMGCRSKDLAVGARSMSEKTCTFHQGSHEFHTSPDQEERETDRERQREKEKQREIETERQTER